MSHAEGAGALATAARLLAADGAAALPAVVAALGAALTVPATVVVRRAEQQRLGDVLAASDPAAGPGTPGSLPRMRSADSAAVVNVPLRAQGFLVGFLCVLAEDDLTAGDVALIAAYADLLALALAAVIRRADTAAHVLDVEAERAEIAAALCEGPVASLVAARYALETGAERPAVGAAVVRQALRELHRVVAAQRGRGLDGDLVKSLGALADDMADAGCLVDLVVTGLPARLPPAYAVTAYRTVAAALDGVTGPATVTVSVATGDVTVAVTGAADPHDAGALDRWARRVRAMDGTFERRSDGVTLHLPSPVPVASTSGAAR